MLEARKDKRKCVQNKLLRSSHLIYTYFTHHCTFSSQIKVLSQTAFSDLNILKKKKKEKCVEELIINCDNYAYYFDCYVEIRRLFGTW